jgi:hypothetical protein
MNNIAISPHIALYALQTQNVKRDVTKKHDVNILNSDSSKEVEKEVKVEEGEEGEEEDKKTI